MTTSISTTLGRRDHLGFKGNLRDTRYGWLRLTPAYSVHLVGELLAAQNTAARVLDPFGGTGTTALVCADAGIACDTTDINPFLLWLTTAKTRAYSHEDLGAFTRAAAGVERALRSSARQKAWIPPLHQIEKWWSAETLASLAQGMAKIQRTQDDLPPRAADLLKIAFCQLVIERANVSFGHQSMSFKQSKQGPANLALWARDEDTAGDAWARAVRRIRAAAESPIRKEPAAFLCDARSLTSALKANTYTAVITSPPYPNRMSYIRELRPYMYWLGFLSNGRDAGELDWQAIGGTWGCATSNLMKWTPSDASVPFHGFQRMVDAIARRSALLSRYVEKYFVDMVKHCGELYRVMMPGGTLHYVVGNSKFYDVVVPVERIYAAMFEAAGFAAVQVRVIRKRSSKKELFEYVVSATK